MISLLFTRHWWYVGVWVTFGSIKGHYSLFISVSKILLIFSSFLKKTTLYQIWSCISHKIREISSIKQMGLFHQSRKWSSQSIIISLQNIFCGWPSMKCVLKVRMVISWNVFKLKQSWFKIFVSFKSKFPSFYWNDFKIFKIYRTPRKQIYYLNFAILWCVLQTFYLSQN